MIRLRPGDLLAAGGSLALLLATFMDWYAPRGRAEGLDAWSAFSVLDVVLALVIALGLALAIAQVAARGPTLPVGINVVTATLATAATVLVAYRLLNQPGPNDAIEVRLGAWLGLLFTATVAGGAWMALADETPRPSDPRPPALERRPAPPGDSLDSSP
jgi:hypothetical protein